MEIYAVKINGLDHPMGFDFEHLLCSWKVRNNKGKKQTRAKIQGKRVKVMSCILRQQSWKIRGRQSGLEYGGKIPIRNSEKTFP